MNKADFIEKIAETADVSKKNADAVMKAFVDVTTEVLKSDDSILLPGFGTFKATERAEREGINPRTKEKVTYAKSKVAKFSASTTLKRALNE